MSLRIRKIIFWFTIIVLAIVLIFFWAKGVQEKLKSFKSPSLFKGFETPEEFQKLKETIRELEQYGKKATTTE